MKANRKARTQPPYWSRAALYVAFWPGSEFADYRVSLHRGYLRNFRKGGKKAANRYARKETFYCLRAAAFRISRLVWILSRFASHK